MSGKHALLGLLLTGPAYPYELGDRVERLLGPAWAVNSGSLYRTVSALEREGLIEPVADARRADRHVFSITDAGVEEFERWLDDTQSVVRLARRPLLLKLTLGGRSRLEQALVELDVYERGCTAQLRELLGRIEAIPKATGLPRADHSLLRVNLSADVCQLEGELEWVGQARERVSWLAEHDALWPRVIGRAGEPGADEGR